MAGGRLRLADDGETQTARAEITEPFVGDPVRQGHGSVPSPAGTLAQTQPALASSS
jgi:hypothetical protein